MELVAPSLERLPSQIAALERGWSPDRLRGAAATAQALAQIAADAAGYIAAMERRDPQGATVTLPDGSTAPRLPGLTRWLWDDEFCGSIDLRWQPGANTLPAYCLGHIGYSVVPWKTGRGYAKQALALLLPYARAVGLDYVELTTDPDNLASQRVIEASGGMLIERFTRPAQYGATPALRWRIAL
jgi:predicted acetyltransferase